MTQTSSQTLDDRSLLLSVEMTTFGNERQMRATDYRLNVADDENERAKAMTKAKQVRLDSPILKEILAFDKETRTILYAITMPSGLRKGVFRLSVDAVDRVLHILTDRAAVREQIVDRFTADYYDAIERTRVAMGPHLFRAKLYPATAQQAAAAFTMIWRFLASGVPELLAAANRAAYEAEMQAFREHLRHIEETYVVINREAVADMVGHLATSLAPDKNGKRKRLYASTVGNIAEFVRNFPLRNLAQDEALATLVARMDGMFAGLDIEVLKSDDELRAFVQAQAQAFKGEVDGLVREAKQGQRQIVL